MDGKGKKAKWRKSSPAAAAPDHQTAEKMAAVGKMISRSCVPLYSRISQNNPTPEIQGTGTLLRLGSHHLMLTAGHVADLSGREGKTLCIRRYNDPKMAFLSFSSKMGYFVTDQKDGGVDPLDIAVIDLPPEYVAELEVGHEFLTLDRLDPADQFAARSAYAVLGYPTSLSGPGPTVFTTNGMLFGGIKYSGDPSLIRDFKPDVHVAIEWSDAGMVDLDGIRKSLPEPGGISGGAIWRTIESGDGLIRPRLVGLVQRWEKSPSVIIGTQIEYALGLIWKCLPGTATVMNLHLPRWRRPGWSVRPWGAV